MIFSLFFNALICLLLAVSLAFFWSILTALLNFRIILDELSHYLCTNSS